MRTRTMEAGGRRSGSRGQRGGAAVEFALILWPFLLLVLGALDYGFFFFSSQVVMHAAREGARVGTLVPPGPNAAVAWSNASSAARTAAFNYMAGNMVYCYPATDASCIRVTQVTVGGAPAIQVFIDYQARSLTGYTQVILPPRVRALATMRWQ